MPAERPVNVVLCGFMGAGKSTVARLLARGRGFVPVDTDDVVIELAGRSIVEVFARGGERLFRRLETRAVRRAASLDGAAIATGGGVPLTPSNLEALGRRGCLFMLETPLGTLLSRIRAAGASRPLAAGGDERSVRALFEARRSFYAALPNVVACGERTPEDVADEVWRRFLSLGGIAPRGGACYDCAAAPGAPGRPEGRER